MAQIQHNIGIMGVGMVGTPLARYFQEVKKLERGKNLFLFDIDPNKNYLDDINQAHVVFVCVPTPPGKDGAADLSAARSAITRLQGEKIIVVKSTVPPGTVESLQEEFPRHHFLFNPEFLTESRAWEDMLNPDRQIVGHTARSKEFASTVLSLLPTAFFSSPGTLGTYTFMRLNATEAEMGKYAGNLFGAFKVTFGNVIKDFCDALGNHFVSAGKENSVDYQHVRAMLGHDRRIGDAWLDVNYQSYRGYGGYCFTKDTNALIHRGEALLRGLPRDSIEKMRLEKGVKFLHAMREYNETLLATQGLTPDDVSVHDHEWIKSKLQSRVMDVNEAEKKTLV